MTANLIAHTYIHILPCISSNDSIFCPCNIITKHVQKQIIKVISNTNSGEWCYILYKLIIKKESIIMIMCLFFIPFSVWAGDRNVGAAV